MVQTMQPFRGFILLVPLVALLLSPQPAAADCEFVLGFATLHDRLPDVVGNCIVDEHHNPTNGDGLQETTDGLLVWRKADNWTAFTDGYRTWVNGPFGLQERLNTQRFAWESNPDGLPAAGSPNPPAGQVSPSPAPSPVPDRCAASRGRASPLCPMA